MDREILSILKSSYLKYGQRLGAFVHAPSGRQIQLMLFGVGVVLLSVGLTAGAGAQVGAAAITYNDSRLTNGINAILTYIEGAFGALVMVGAGIGAIMSAAFGQYRAALGLLACAVGAFILRSIMSTFFNDVGIRG